jgi:hypothetical protein
MNWWFCPHPDEELAGGDEATDRASWFETAFGLLTMRIKSSAAQNGKPT